MKKQQYLAFNTWNDWSSGRNNRKALVAQKGTFYNSIALRIFWKAWKEIRIRQFALVTLPCEDPSSSSFIDGQNASPICAHNKYNALMLHILWTTCKCSARKFTPISPSLSQVWCNIMNPVRNYDYLFRPQIYKYCREGSDTENTFCNCLQVSTTFHWPAKKYIRTWSCWILHNPTEIFTDQFH